MSEIKKRVLHPGYHIKEYMDAIEIDASKFASELGMSIEELNLIISFKASINLDIANKLSARIGTSVEFWLRLQANYDAYIRKLNKH